MVVTALVGCTVVFLLGCIVGSMTEPVPGMLGGVSVLGWLAPALVVVAALPALVVCQRQRAVSLQRPRTVNLVSVKSPSTESISEDVGSALDLFPTEALTSTR